MLLIVVAVILSYFFQICQIWPNINEFSNFLQEVELFHSSLPTSPPSNSDKNNSNSSLRKQKTNPYQLTRHLFLIILRRIALFCHSNVINASLLVNLPSFPFIFHLIITTAYIKSHRTHELLFRHCFEAIIALVHNQKEIAIQFVHNSDDLIAVDSKEEKKYRQLTTMTMKKNEEGLMEWLFHFLEHHSNYSMKVIELSLQLLDNLLNAKENKRYFEEYLCYHGILLTVLSTYEPKSLTIVEFSFSCFLHLIENDDNDSKEINENELLTGQISSSSSSSFLLTTTNKKEKNKNYHIRILSFVENMKIIFKIIEKYYENQIHITELSLHILYCLAITSTKEIKLRDFLFNEKIPRIITNFIQIHGSYHSLIAELAIHTIAILTYSTPFPLISSSSFGGISGIILLMNIFKKQEVTNSLTAFYALIAIRILLKADEEILLKNNSTLYYALGEYGIQVIIYVISMIRQYLEDRSYIAMVGLEILSLLATKNDIEIWIIIADHNGIDILLFILNKLLLKEDEKSRKTIQKALETLLSFVNLEESLYKRFEKLLSLSLLLNLLKYHGKYSLSLLSFVIHSFIILYPTKLSSSSVNKKCDEETIEIVLSLFYYYNERFNHLLDAQAIFATHDDDNDNDDDKEEKEEEEEKRWKEESEMKRNQEMKKMNSYRISHRSLSSTSLTKSSFSRSMISSSSLIPAASFPSPSPSQLPLNQHDDYLCSLLCLDALIFLTSIPINQIYFINSLHFHNELLHQMKQKKSFHQSMSIPIYPRIDSDSQQPKKSIYHSEFSFYFIKCFQIIKQFVLIQNFHKKFIKEGICKTLIEFLEFGAYEIVELSYVLLEIIILFAVHYKLTLGESEICEWILKILVFYNNIYEDDSSTIIIINNQIVELCSHCIVNMSIHSNENKERFLSLRVLNYPVYGIRFEDFDIILYLQLLLRNSHIMNNTRLDIKDAINVLKFD
jgi:hypothetical protein